jgi:hypothetical protein
VVKTDKEMNGMVKTDREMRGNVEMGGGVSRR